jgi:hypothetical protein
MPADPRPGGEEEPRSAKTEAATGWENSRGPGGFSALSRGFLPQSHQNRRRDDGTASAFCAGKESAHASFPRVIWDH